MDIILLDNNLDEIANSSCSDLLTDEEKRKVCNYAGLDQETSDFKRINIGPGADLFVILAAIWKTIEVVGTVYRDGKSEREVSLMWLAQLTVLPSNQPSKSYLYEHP